MISAPQSSEKEKMDEIRIIEKPDGISFDAIHDLLYEANAANRSQGLVMRTVLLTGDEIQKRIGEDGKCWVALCGDTPVGTLSVRVKERNAWYCHGEIPEYMLAAVLPEYTGKHINSALSARAFEFAGERGFQMIELNTAENNSHAIEVYLHQGFQKVGFLAPRDADHYSVVMVKWLEKCPHSALSIRLRYFLQRLYVKIRFKKGGKRRF